MLNGTFKGQWVSRELPPLRLIDLFVYQLLFGTQFEWTDGFAHQMLSHCTVLHAVRLALNLAPFVLKALLSGSLLAHT